MDMNMISQINYWAVLVCGVVYFVIGMFWFAPGFFGTLWRKELEKHRVLLTTNQNMMFFSMGITFASCFLAAFGLAWLIQCIGYTTAFSGFMLGCIISACFVIPSVATIFVWENRSMMLFLIDVGYPVAGIIISAIILTLWQ